MSPKASRRPATAGSRAHALVFAALGDETRLSIVTRLAVGRPCSISQLTAGSHLTRQAITKHLQVLEHVGIVRRKRTGREMMFAFDPEPIQQMRAYLAYVAEHWDQALARLGSFVED